MGPTRRGDARVPRSVDSLERAEQRRSIAVASARVVVVSSLMVVVYYALPFDWEPRLHVVSIAVGLALLVAGLVLWPLRSVSRATLPELRAIEAMGVAATLSLVLFASTYLVLSNGDAAAFSEPLGHTDALYLSMTTLTTVGFGDVSASSEPARVAVMLQMITTFVVLGFVVRLVSRVVRRSLTDDED